MGGIDARRLLMRDIRGRADTPSLTLCQGLGSVGGVPVVRERSFKGVQGLDLRPDGRARVLPEQRPGGRRVDTWRPSSDVEPVRSGPWGFLTLKGPLIKPGKVQSQREFFSRGCPRSHFRIGSDGLSISGPRGNGPVG